MQNKLAKTTYYCDTLFLLLQSAFNKFQQLIATLVYIRIRPVKISGVPGVGNVTATIGKIQKLAYLVFSAAKYFACIFIFSFM